MSDHDIIGTRRQRPVADDLPLFALDQPKARASDPSTSQKAADVRLGVRAGSARYKLLQAHHAHPNGLTDEEAALAAGLSLGSEYATRCSELNNAGLLCILTRDGVPVERAGASGIARMVRVLTDAGKTAL